TAITLAFGSISGNFGGSANNRSVTIGAVGNTLNISLGIGTHSIDVPSGDSLTLGGVIIDGGSPIKNGGGTLIFTNTNTYGGATTINGGTLVIEGSIASSPTTVNSGGTLGGSGTTDGITVNSGGTLAPGLSPGILRTGNINLASGAIYAAELNGTAAGSGGY